MALEGSLKDFGLADILQLIYFQRKTGVLTIEGSMDRVRLLIIEGNIAGAESKKRIEDNRIGKILYKKGLIQEQDLQQELEEQRRTGAKLGNILINMELVDKPVIQDILKNQITETIIQLFGWKQGTYKFSAQGVPQDKDFAFSIDTQHLLMDGLRIVDEWSLLKGKISLDTVFVKKTESPEDLTKEEAEIFSYIDGESDLSTIVDISSSDSSQVSKTVMALMEKGIIAVREVETPPAEEARPEPKKHMPFLNYLPYATIVISLILSISVVIIFQHADIFKKVRASSQIDELRFKIETYRFEHKEYPQSLNLVSNLKDPWQNPFIYKVTDRSFYLASMGADGREDTGDEIF